MSLASPTPSHQSMHRAISLVVAALLIAGAAATGCAGTPQTHDPSAASKPPEPATFTAQALVTSEQPRAGAAVVYELLSSETVQQEAGVTADQVSLAQTRDGVRLKLTAASAPLAVAQCSSMLLAARLQKARTPSGRRWVEKGVDRLRDELRQLQHSLVVAPHRGACAREDSVPGLKMCVERRVEKLSQEEMSPRQYHATCDRGLLCSIAKEWAARTRNRSELAQSYGSAHPDIVQVDRALSELVSWFDAQRKTEVAALRAMLSHIEGLTDSPPANVVDLLRVEVGLEHLEADSFAIDAGVASLVPWPVRLASFEFGIQKVELQRLQTLYKHKHPQIVAQKATLDRMRRDFEVLVEFQRARLETDRAMLQDDETRRLRTDARLMASREKLEQLLGVLEAVQALPSPQPADLQIVQACRASNKP